MFHRYGESTEEANFPEAISASQPLVASGGVDAEICHAMHFCTKAECNARLSVVSVVSDALPVLCGTKGKAYDVLMLWLCAGAHLGSARPSGRGLADCHRQ